MIKLIPFTLLILLFAGCNSNKNAEKLPILGRSEITETDTIYHQIKDFVFVNQDSVEVGNKTFDGKIYVSDFFFTTCPTICPVMKGQMMRIYDHYLEEPDVMLLSHTIDPEHDSVAVLKEYAEQLGITSEKWHMVTGEKETIYETAQTSYYATAAEDELEPGGFIHSGAFILVDKERHIRGIYDGTDPEAVDKLIGDIERLLAEYQG